VAHVVTRRTVGPDELAAFQRPRTDLLLERALPDGAFEAAEGPLLEYRRSLDVRAGDSDQYEITQTVDFRLAVPYAGWLFVLPFRHAIARPPRTTTPWWAPPVRLDARSSSVLGTLAVLSIIFAYLGTLFTQTVSFAGEEFGAGNSAQGVAGAVVRVGGVIALIVVASADRKGRRIVILWAALAGCVFALSGAVAPSLPWLTASQTLARAFSTALLVLVAIVSAEEVPAGARAYAVSLLAMAAGFGAGICLMALRLADLGTQGWRLLYVIPVLALPLLRGVARRLPETRRFEKPHIDVRLGTHRNQLLLLAISGLLVNIFVAPQSQFFTRFLRTEHGFSGASIGLLAIVAGTPGAIGIIVGGRLADLHGRKIVGAFALSVGTLCTVAFFLAGGIGLWVWAMAGSVIFAASAPALGVYGPELFPTSLRGRANGILAVTGLAGSAIGLIAVGLLSDEFDAIGPAMAMMAVGPIFVAGLVLARYPETARRELEDINPEDRSLPQ
jgi:MFS family permease